MIPVTNSCSLIGQSTDLDVISNSQES